MIGTRNIVITQKDFERLQELLRSSRLSRGEGEEYLRALTEELDRATIVAPEDVSADTITMNSTVRVATRGSRGWQTWTIVYPDEANMDDGRISVLAPLGTALLGYRVGDTVEWDVPAGRRTYRIVEVVHQPEAAGEWDR
ncbi:MAG: nucleoside diphosphate kinase regulator [Phycisphaerales bacterium]|nr:nucleoside diphosphate kinase regulator [Phycisphaerales bacterium]